MAAGGFGVDCNIMGQCVLNQICDCTGYVYVADLVLHWSTQPQHAHWPAKCQMTVGSQEAPAKIQEVTLMRPFHGNL